MNDWFSRLHEWISSHLNGRILAIAVIALVVLAFFGGNAYQDWRSQGEGLTLVDEGVSDMELSTAQEDSEKTATGEVVVHVIGAVSAPGVYTLPENARVDDAVRAAGATETADLAQLNLAQKLADGQKITVPAIGETPAAENSEEAASTSTESDALVNINTASQAELETLPSIGEVRAQAIISYRETNGGFRTIEELQEVSGIGEKIFADVAPHVTV